MVSKPAQPRSRLVVMMGWLLFFQAVSLVAFGIYHFLILQFGPELLTLWWSQRIYGPNRLLALYGLLTELFTTASSQHVLSTLVESLLLFLLAILALFASFGFFFRRKFAWILAMSVQGSMLTLALIIYLIQKPLHTYFLMIYGIIMVIYLQHADIYQSFRKVNLLSENEP